MKLVLLYGPPASGKLTTARALASVTGFAWAGSGGRAGLSPEQ